MEFYDFSRTLPKIQGLFKTVRTLKEPDSSNNSTQQREVQESGNRKPVQTLGEEPGGVPMGIPMHIRDMDLEGLTPAQKEMA